MFQKDDRWLYELSYAAPIANNKWRAGAGAIWDLKTDATRPRGWTSTDAAGLQVLPLLIRYDEVYGSGPIRHALRCSVNVSQSYVWPALHPSANQTDGLPMGMRLRLKASTVITGYPTHIQKILQCMKDYGLIVADRGGNMYLQGTRDPRWGHIYYDFNIYFKTLNITNFDILKLSYQPFGKPGITDPDIDET
jgi:hypothetical protein